MAGRANGCGQWVDSPVTGNFEQYVIGDVVPFVDVNYRTIASQAGRGVFAFSSGGFGSWNLASKHRTSSAQWPSCPPIRGST